MSHPYSPVLSAFAEMVGVGDLETKVQTLRSLVQLLVDYSEVVIEEWEAEQQPHCDAAFDTPHTVPPLPSRQLYEAQRVVRGACGMVIDLVQDPRTRLLELSTSLGLAQAFDTTVRAGVPDLLASADESGGLPLTELSTRSGVDERELGSFFISYELSY